MIYPGVRSEIGSAIRTAHDRATVVRTLEAQVAALFASRGSLPRLWLDPSDPATRFQDLAGTAALTTAGQGFGRLADKSGAGNHVGQAVAGSRPLLQIDGNGLPYAFADGADDSLYSLASFDLSLTDKMTLIAAFRKRNDAIISPVYEHGPNFNTTSGTFGLFAPDNTNLTRVAAYAKGTGAATNAVKLGVPAPFLAVSSHQIDLAANTNVMWINGTAVDVAGSGALGGSFISAVFNLCRRNNTSLPGAIDFYGLMAFGGPLLNAAERTLCQQFLASKSGVML